MGNDGDVDQSDLLSRLVESAKDQEGDEEMEKLKSHIKLNEAFSGIKFKSTDWEVKYTGMWMFLHSLTLLDPLPNKK